MAFNNDTSSYNDYELTVEKLLTDVDSQLQIIKKSGVVSEADYNEYSSYLSQWGNIGYSIIENIKKGNKDKATEEILNKCTPALNKVVEKAISLDDIADMGSSQQQPVKRLARSILLQGLLNCCAVWLALG